MIAFSGFYLVKRQQNQPGKGTIMSISYTKQIILIGILATLPLHSAIADSFMDTLLRFSGISVTASQLRGRSFIEGNLWLIKIDGASANEAKQITSDGTYHSPLWIPGSDKILAVKGSKLIQLDIERSEEKMLHILSDHTVLLGFDKRDANSILILQDSEPAVLSLTNGQITFLTYDKENSENRSVLDGLKSNYRDYGNKKVFIDEKRIRDASGFFKKINKIHIKDGKQDTVIPCPADCAQPALTEDGRRLIFVGQ